MRRLNKRARRHGKIPERYKEMPYTFNDGYERHASQAQNEQRSGCMQQLEDARNTGRTIASIEEALAANIKIVHRSVKVAHSLPYEFAGGNAALIQR